MQRPEIERLLPAVFRHAARPGTPLLALLDVMEDLHAPSEAVLDELERYFDPYRTPDAFVPFLAHWVDLARLTGEPRPRPESSQRLSELVDVGRLRELVAAAARLASWRGTDHGLRLFLETATGVAGFVVDEAVTGEDGAPRPFHIRVLAPAAAQPQRALVERVVELEKPAYVTHEIAFEEG